MKETEDDDNGVLPAVSTCDGEHRVIVVNEGGDGVGTHAASETHGDAWVDGAESEGMDEEGTAAANDAAAPNDASALQLSSPGIASPGSAQSPSLSRLKSRVSFVPVDMRKNVVPWPCLLFDDDFESVKNIVKEAPWLVLSSYDLPGSHEFSRGMSRELNSDVESPSIGLLLGDKPQPSVVDLTKGRLPIPFQPNVADFSSTHSPNYPGYCRALEVASHIVNAELALIDGASNTRKAPAQQESGE